MFRSPYLEERPGAQTAGLVFVWMEFIVLTLLISIYYYLLIVGGNLHIDEME